jgi:hypothetical protein
LALLSESENVAERLFVSFGKRGFAVSAPE